MGDGSILVIGVFAALYFMLLMATQMRVRRLGDRSIAEGASDRLTEFFVAGRSVNLPVAVATLWKE